MDLFHIDFQDVIQTIYIIGYDHPVFSTNRLDNTLPFLKCRKIHPSTKASVKQCNV